MIDFIKDADCTKETPVRLGVPDAPIYGKGIKLKPRVDGRTDSEHFKKIYLPELLPLEEYDLIVVLISGGKDSVACYLKLLELGVPKERIEFWHHDIDGGHPSRRMDWKCTQNYVKALADAEGIKLRVSYRVNGFFGELYRIGDFKQYAGKTILNNVYMDLRGKKPIFKRTRTAIEKNIFATIKRCAKKLKPEYNGDVYLETVRCYFDISQENLEKCRYTYQGNETYAFLMSDKYIMALYTHCLVARKEAAVQDWQVEGFTEKEYEMVRLENVGDVLFQALMLDDVKIKDGMMYADFLSVILDNIVDNY